MENASKALLIAGSILLFILLSSFSSYMFTRARNRTNEIYGVMASSQVDTFNQKFLKYEDKEVLKIQDVVSIINFAKDCNRSGKQPIEIKVTAQDGIIEGANTNLLADDIDINSILEKNINKEYKCTTSYGSNSNLIENIYIENK